MRGDLPPGLQAAQAVHAMAQFAVEHPCITRKWVKDSNYLVIVSVPDEDTLFTLAAESNFGRRVKTVMVYEPDIGDEATAVAFAPDPEVRRLLANYPLALREVMPA